MKRLIFAGNCQVLSLSNLYRKFVSGTTGDIVEYIDVHLAVPDEVVDERRRTIGSADILVSQVTATKAWLDVGSFDTAGVTHLLPVVGAGFLWPFAGQTHPGSAQLHYRPFGAEYSDAYLNKLIARGVAPEQALLEYKSLDVNTLMGLDRLFELWIDKQATRDEIAGGYYIHSIIKEHFRREPLFRTPYHPNLRVYNHLIETLFPRLDVDGDVVARILSSQRMSPFENLELPIHPSVARHFRLPYVTANSVYRCREEGSFTFDEWVLRYMTHEWNEELLDGLRLQHSDRKAAFGLLRSGIEKSPRSVVGRTILGRSLQAEGKAEEALTQLRTAIDLQSRDADGLRAVADLAGPSVELAHVYGELGHLLLRQGDLEGAAAAFSKAVELDDSATGFYNALAGVLARLGRHEAAVSLLRGLAERGTLDAHVHHQLGHLLARQDDLNAAETAFRRAIELDPVPTGFHNALAGILDRQGRSDEALAIVNALIEAGTPDAHVHGQLGHLLNRRGELPAAEAAFRRAIELDPKVTGFYNALVNVLDRQGRGREGMAILEDLVRAETRDAHIHAHLGRLLVPLGELDRAEKALRRAIELDPAVTGFRDSLDSVIKQQAQRQEALQNLRFVSEEPPGLLVLTFGQGGNASNYQGRGWSGPELGFAWTQGQEAELLLPRGEPNDYMVTVIAGVFCPESRPWQRVEVKVGNTVITRFVAEHRTPEFNIWIPRSIVEETSHKIRVIFSLPDASRPSDHSAHHDTRIIALAFRSLVMRPLGRNPLLTLMRATESLGRNCEFGFVQRKFGIEGLSLLRWAGGSTASLVDALRNEFGGLADAMTGRGVPANKPAEAQHWWLTCSRYGIIFHTDESVGRTTVAQATDTVRPRLRRLADKLIGDIRAGEKVLVYSSAEFDDPRRGAELIEALRELGGRGPILIVAAGADEPVTPIGVNVWGARVPRLTEMGDAAATDVAPWLRVLSELRHALPRDWLAAYCQ